MIRNYFLTVNSGKSQKVTRSSSNSLTGRFSKASLVGRFALLAFLMLACVGGVAGQTIDTDGFEDGDYINDPAWQLQRGGNNDFSVISVVSREGSNSLKMDLSDASSDLYIYYDRQKTSLDSGDTVTFSIYTDSTDECIVANYGTSIDNTGGVEGIICPSVAVETDGGSNSYEFKSGHQADTWYIYEMEFYPSNSEVVARAYEGVAAYENDNFLGETTISYSGFDNLEYVNLWGNDNAGNPVYWDAVSYENFNTAPSVDSTNVSPDPPLIGESVSYSLQASDSDGTVESGELTVFKDGQQVYTDTQSFSSGSVSYTWSDVYVPSSSGDLDAKFTITDDAGASTTEWVNRTLPDTAPDIQIIKPVNQTYTSTEVPASVYLDDTDSNPGEDNTVTLFNDGQEILTENVTESGYVNTTINTTNGPHNFTATVEDQTGNTNSAPTIYYTVDSAPEISFNPSTTSSGTFSQDWIFVNVSATDNKALNSVTEEFDGVNSSFSTNQGDNYWTNHTVLADGTYSFQGFAEDTFGSVTSTGERTVTLDSTTPTVNILSPENQTYNTLSIPFEVSSSELVDWEYELNSQGLQSFTPNTSFDNLDEGSYNLEVFGTDDAGNTGSDSVGFTVDYLEPNITLVEPADGEIYAYPDYENDVQIQFDWSVEGGSENGNTTLYISGNNAYEDSFNQFTTNDFTYTEALSSGSYSYYVEVETEKYTKQSETRSFTVEQRTETRPQLTLDVPESNAVYRFGPLENQAEVKFRYSIDAGSEDGTSEIYLNGSLVNSEPFTMGTTDTYTYRQNLSAGNYEYFVEADTPLYNVESFTRSFTVEQRPMNRPVFNLSNPENGSSIVTENETKYTVNFAGSVQAETNGTVDLELDRPGVNGFTSIANFTVEAGKKTLFNVSENFTGIDFVVENPSFNASREYEWRLAFDSTDVNQSFESNISTFNFQDVEADPTEEATVGFLEGIGAYWDAFIRNSNFISKAFVGFMIVVSFGGLGYWLAGSTGAAISMTTTYLVATISGLFPGWLLLAIVISALAYIFMVKGGGD